MRILLLSFYYPPDLSAGSFRAAALVKALTQAGSTGLTIDVLTTVPNRYKSFDVSSLPLMMTVSRVSSRLSVERPR